MWSSGPLTDISKKVLKIFVSSVFACGVTVPEFKSLFKFANMTVIAQNKWYVFVGRQRPRAFEVWTSPWQSDCDCLLNSFSKGAFVCFALSALSWRDLSFAHFPSASKWLWLQPFVSWVTCVLQYIYWKHCSVVYSKLNFDLPSSQRNNTFYWKGFRLIIVSSFLYFSI